MYYCEISGNGINFGLPFGTDYTLAFSRILYGSEVLVAYTVSGHPRKDLVVVDSGVHPAGKVMKSLYPAGVGLAVQKSVNGTAFVKLDLAAHQFVILA